MTPKRGYLSQTEFSDEYVETNLRKAKIFGQGMGFGIGAGLLGLGLMLSTPARVSETNNQEFSQYAVEMNYIIAKPLDRVIESETERRKEIESQIIDMMKKQSIEGIMQSVVPYDDFNPKPQLREEYEPRIERRYEFKTRTKPSKKRVEL